MRFRNVGECLAMLFSVVAVFACAGSVWAAPKAVRGSSTTQPAPELCLGAVDPFDRSTQKAGFFAIAGKDGELTGQEFQDASDKTSNKAFLRSFDTFAALSRFDKDKN